MIRAACAALFIASALPSGAGAFSLSLPIDCDLGATCYIQQYVDHDPGRGARDFTCAGLSYDGHKGTDFGLPTLQDMARGVTVRAAAPGVVRGVRDEMEDRIYEGRDLGGRDCGNGVAIRHENGWETQYCHLKRGSVTVQPGQRVEAGAPLGLVGLSGRTQFPHLHLSVRRDGEVVDPFAPDGGAACGSDRGLWDEPPLYRAGGLLDLGFADRIPSYDAVKDGTANDAGLTPGAAALVGYGYAFGGRRGDVLRIEIDGPGGFTHRGTATLEKDQSLFFRASGRKRPDGGWAPGRYVLMVSLVRGGEVISTRRAEMVME